jgi:hypothetical protein
VWPWTPFAMEEPVEKALAESFNGRLRDDRLNVQNVPRARTPSCAHGATVCGAIAPRSGEVPPQLASPH